MKSIGSLILGMSLLASATTTHATTLAYQWKQGTTKQFDLRSTTTIKSTKNQGLFRLGVTIKNRVLFTRKVLQVLPNGHARVQFRIDRIMSSFNGMDAIATNRLPKQAREWTAIVNQHGTIQTRHHIGYVMREGKLFVVSFQSTAPSSNGARRVQLYGTAKFQRGRVTGAIRLHTKQTHIQINKDESIVEWLPKDLFDLMSLPKRSMKQGSSVKVTSPLMNITTSLGNIRKGRAPLQIDITTPRQQPAGRRPAPKMGGFPGMPSGMGFKAKGNTLGIKMGNMGMPGSMQAMMPQTTGSIRLLFDVTKGQFVRSSGTWKQVIPQISLSIQNDFMLTSR